MEKYFCENILERINNVPNLYIAYFLFEGAVYSLIKRRDPYKKSSYREMSLGGIENNSNMNYASSSMNLMNNNNSQGFNENVNNVNNVNNSLGKQGIFILKFKFINFFQKMRIVGILRIIMMNLSNKMKDQMVIFLSFLII